MDYTQSNEREETQASNDMVPSRLSAEVKYEGWGETKTPAQKMYQTVG